MMDRDWEETVREISSKRNMPIQLRANPEPEYLFEVFSTLALVRGLATSGCKMTSDVLHFERYNQLPYFAPTQGGQNRKIGNVHEIQERFVPLGLLRKQDDYLSVFYQGFPFVSTRLRPDITLVSGRPITAAREGIGQDLLEVSLQLNAGEPGRLCRNPLRSDDATLMAL